MASFFRKLRYEQQCYSNFNEKYNEYKRVMKIAEEDKKNGKKQDCIQALTVGVELLDSIIEFDCNLELTRNKLKKVNIKNIQQANALKEELNEQAMSISILMVTWVPICHTLQSYTVIYHMPMM